MKDGAEAGLTPSKDLARSGGTPIFMINGRNKKTPDVFSFGGLTMVDHSALFIRRCGSNDADRAICDKKARTILDQAFFLAFLAAGLAAATGAGAGAVIASKTL